MTGDQQAEYERQSRKTSSDYYDFYDRPIYTVGVGKNGEVIRYVNGRRIDDNEGTGAILWLLALALVTSALIGFGLAFWLWGWQ